MKKIPCTLMRGGTSKGVFLLADSLPNNITERDELILAIMGSGHPLQIDGIGGGSPQTSKVAIISQSTHPDADVDYLFAQVAVTERIVDTAPNCGNMLCAVGPFAIEQGLVSTSGDLTTVRIRNINTDTFVHSTVQTPDGKVRYDGETEIAGVPGRSAPIALTFLNACGSKTGKLLPTGNVIDTIDGIDVSCIDMAVPVVLIDAPQLNKTGYETAAELEADKAFMQQVESIRLQAGIAMGLGDVSKKVIPKPILVSPAINGGTINVRYFMPHKCHGALAVTGAIAIAMGVLLPDSIIQQYIDIKAVDTKNISIEHLSGKFEVSLTQKGNFPEGVQASIIRTARKLLVGDVFVP